MLLPGAIVRAGARVERAIVDDAVVVGREAKVGAAGGDVALLGLRAELGDGEELPAGARFPDEAE